MGLDENHILSKWRWDEMRLDKIRLEIRWDLIHYVRDGIRWEGTSMDDIGLVWTGLDYISLHNVGDKMRCNENKWD